MRKRSSMEPSVRGAPSRSPRSVGYGQIDRDGLARATLELEAAVAVEREGELAGQETLHRVTEQLAAPTVRQPGLGIAGEERRQVRPGREQHRVDAQFAAELAQPGRHQGDGRPLVALDVVAAR